jgi:hypothetical protein
LDVRLGCRRKAVDLNRDFSQSGALPGCQNLIHFFDNLLAYILKSFSSSFSILSSGSHRLREALTQALLKIVELSFLIVCDLQVASYIVTTKKHRWIRRTTASAGALAPRGSNRRKNGHGKDDESCFKIHSRMSLPNGWAKSTPIIEAPKKAH